MQAPSLRARGNATLRGTSIGSWSRAREETILDIGQVPGATFLEPGRALQSNVHTTSEEDSTDVVLLLSLDQILHLVSLRLELLLQLRRGFHVGLG